MTIPVERLEVVNADFQRESVQRDGEWICTLTIRGGLLRCHV